MKIDFLCFFRQKLRMNINRIGYHYIHNANFVIDREEGSGDFLLLILKTPAQFVINGQKKNAAAGSFIFFKKGTRQIYKATDVRFINDWIHLELSEADIQEIKKLEIPFDKIIQLSEISSVSDLIRNLSSIYYGNGIHRDETIQHYLRLIFLRLSEKLHYQSDSHYGNHYENIMQLRSDIYNAPYTDWSIDRMAGQAQMSRSYFQHIYRQIVGISAIEDVILSRIEHAKHLLSSSSSTIISISEQCGYSNEQHFVRQFKKSTGLTPKEFRMKSRLKQEME